MSIILNKGSKEIPRRTSLLIIVSKLQKYNRKMSIDVDDASSLPFKPGPRTVKQYAKTPGNKDIY